eukprot:6504269-Pyramimonas_sp.AAC.1
MDLQSVSKHIAGQHCGAPWLHKRCYPSELSRTPNVAWSIYTLHQHIRQSRLPRMDGAGGNTCRA